MRLPLTALTAAFAAAVVLAWPGNEPGPRPSAHVVAAAPTPLPGAAGSRAETGGRDEVILVRAVFRDPARAAVPPTRSPARTVTGWAALDSAIAQIPYYVPGVARWHVADKGAWGMTVFATGNIYVAPRTPADKLVSVVKHEWAHALTSRIYGGFEGAAAAADQHFAQAGVAAFEVEADCMALVEGATWTWYSACSNAHWRSDALALLQSRRP